MTQRSGWASPRRHPGPYLLAALGLVSIGYGRSGGLVPVLALGLALLVLSVALMAYYRHRDSVARLQTMVRTDMSSARVRDWQTWRASSGYDEETTYPYTYR